MNSREVWGLADGILRAFPCLKRSSFLFIHINAGGAKGKVCYRLPCYVKKDVDFSVYFTTWERYVYSCPDRVFKFHPFDDCTYERGDQIIAHYC